ncbi:hydroxyacid dehydrogenase [Staphylococcus pasteuri]|uniref:phosphoglycerate dehydrogenase n=1 Tax=Staphylococcus pasteuri TaxID=45972 RepID=UPI000BC304DE|nr:phosphoglycerate dehydrogenase [Staphylococcus pasteuri]ATH62312.1 hydroxyacid dehydrogenase [Staphylococcus pasteuri]
MKVVSLFRLGELEDELVEKFPQVDFKFIKKAKNIPFEERQSLDILIGYDGELDESFLKDCPNLKWIAWYATGVNSLPLDYLKNHNIKLTNSRGVQAKQLSEFILAFILDDYKKMRTSFINQQNKVYDSKMVGRRLSGDKVLFLGTGAIASRAAKLAKAFDMQVIGLSNSGKDKEWFDEVYKIEKLNEVIGEVDIIINALPETNKTIHLLQYDHFKQMSNNALFINVGRGTIVKETTILKVLKENLIRHAYLDVFENEPLDENNPLYELDNVTITAHITGNDNNINKEVTDIFVNNLKHFLNNKDLIENIVDLNKGY